MPKTHKFHIGIANNEICVGTLGNYLDQKRFDEYSICTNEAIEAVCKYLLKYTHRTGEAGYEVRVNDNTVMILRACEQRIPFHERNHKYE